MIRFPAEWESQDGVMITFPHADSDWLPYLDEATETFIEIANAIARFEKCLIVCDNRERIRKLLPENPHFIFAEIPTNDTWCRDYGPLAIEQNGEMRCLDFTFDGWGGKFDASLDNRVTRVLECMKYLPALLSHSGFILEGGSIESDGEGTLLTTTACLLNKNRNAEYSQAQIEAYLKDALGSDHFLWLHSGFLVGDDTDSHIDMLARLIAKETIMYVRCEDVNNIHYEALKQMEGELQEFRTKEGKPYQLIPLPFPDSIFFEAEQLPASYANFLIINGAVLVPIYGVLQDQEALRIFQESFPGKEIIPIDCSVLIRQHGSLHCSTMQLPKGTLL